MLGAMVDTNAASSKTSVYNYLVNQLHYNSAAAAGICANIQCESGYRPTAGSRAYGLCQWMGGRRSAMVSYCRSHGYSSSSAKGQLRYLDYELRTHYRSLYRSLKRVSNNRNGAYKAGQMFCYHFERPANKASVSRKRAAIARGLYRSVNRTFYCNVSSKKYR